jgi:hypothetical protein
MNDSVFDYDISPNELSELGILLNKEEYNTSTSRIKRFYDLHRLFKLRGNEDKASEILTEASVILKLTDTI